MSKTLVTVKGERNKFGPRNYEELWDIQNEQDELINARIRVERYREFAEDPTRDEMVNLGFGPGQGFKYFPTDIEGMKQTDTGISGIYTMVEPTDLELYRSYLQKPLAMPDNPKVSLVVLDFNCKCGVSNGNPFERYQEGQITIKAKCPNGEEAWVVVSMPVSHLIRCYIGMAQGLPKYVADETTVGRNRAEVKYEGEVRFSLDLTSSPVEDVPSLAQKVLRQGGMVMFMPTKQGICPVIITTSPAAGTSGSSRILLDQEVGLVRAYISPKDPWAGLIPNESVTPGLFQRAVVSGQVDQVHRKIKG